MVIRCRGAGVLWRLDGLGLWHRMILLRIAIIFKRLALLSEAALSGMAAVPMPRIPDPVVLRADLVDLLKARMRLTLDRG